jgi:hypothetical protein
VDGSGILPVIRLAALVRRPNFNFVLTLTTMKMLNIQVPANLHAVALRPLPACRFLIFSSVGDNHAWRAHAVGLNRSPKRKLS